jgi:hypothetical protein
MEAAAALAGVSGAGILGVPPVAAALDTQAARRSITGAREALATVPSLAAVREALAAVPVCADGAGMVDQLRELEDLKSVAAAKQADIAVAFDLFQRRVQAAAGVPADEQGAGVGPQIALARRESPARGGRLLGLGKALVTEMPRTFAALRNGQLNEWRTTLVVRETACLSAEDRQAVDESSPRTPAPLTGTGTAPSLPRSVPRRTGGTRSPWRGGPAVP